MRKLIAGFKISLDGKMESPQGMADWAESWSEDYGLTEQIDACILGGKMYPGYENYWSGLQQDPDKVAWIKGVPPTPKELEWARFAACTPHYVLSQNQSSARWSNTSFLRNLDDVAGLKNQSGKDIYLMGGGQIAMSLIEAGLVDELRLLVHPLIAGPGTSLFATPVQRRALELLHISQEAGGLVRLDYAVKALVAAAA